METLYRTLPVLVSCAYRELLCVNGYITLPAFLCTFISFGDTVEGSLVGFVLVVLCWPAPMYMCVRDSFTPPQKMAGLPVAVSPLYNAHTTHLHILDGELSQGVARGHLLFIPLHDFKISVHNLHRCTHHHINNHYWENAIDTTHIMSSPKTRWLVPPFYKLVDKPHKVSRLRS